VDSHDLARLEKQGWQYAEGESVPIDEKDRFKGVIRQQNTRRRNIRDVLNIGSGTRCRHCGMLHFCYLERCGACSKPMDYNVATTDGVV